MLNDRSFNRCFLRDYTEIDFIDLHMLFKLLLFARRIAHAFMFSNINITRNVVEETEQIWKHSILIYKIFPCVLITLKNQ